MGSGCLVMTSWTWAAASCVGTSHVRTNTRRQDAYSCSISGIEGDTLIAVVSDGAGSASRGGEGASLACRTLISRARKYFSNGSCPDSEQSLAPEVPSPEVQQPLEPDTSSDEELLPPSLRHKLLPRAFQPASISSIFSGWKRTELHENDQSETVPSADAENNSTQQTQGLKGEEKEEEEEEEKQPATASMPSEAILREWIMEARKNIFLAAETRSQRPREFAATLVFAISTGTETIVAHIGDGAAVFQSSETSEWQVASWPQHGEYASTTYFLTDAPEPLINFSRFTDSISALALFSDGIEMLALELNERQPHQRFFESIFRPLQASPASGRDHNLCNGLAKFLDSEKVNGRTDDDKTLILAVKR
jgi:serine/threonine protein phosphatase PrpC